MNFDPNHDIVKIGTIVQYLKVLDLSTTENSMYRGQVNSEWGLNPSLERFHIDVVGGDYYGSWKELEDMLLDEFIRRSKPFMDFTPENRLEWMVHAQHYGLPTALLDWTTNPLKALFFAVESSQHDNCDGTVNFGVGAFYATEEIQNLRGEKVEELFCFKPKHINERVVNQEGCFTLFPLPDSLDKFVSLSVERQREYGDFWLYKKVIIPSDCKLAIRRELATLGITRQAIYPGLDSISDSIKRKFLDGGEWY